MPTSKPLEQGDRLGDYEIVSVAGIGGMGIVYRAKQHSLGRNVALKVIRDEIASEPEYRQRFMREARLAASVDHPHVVTVYDVDSEDERLYLVMQWIDGVDLKQHLQESGRLSPERALAIGTQLAGALDALHGISGLIHRDVKPANVLIREVAGEDRAYLTDFGVAKPPEGVDDLTKTGSTVGTPGYLSPEQIQGGKPSPRSDLYALGCVVFETLTGEQPFKGENEQAIRWAHANHRRPMASESQPGLGRRYDRFFSTALAVDPAERFGSGREFAEALAQAQASEGETEVTSIIPGYVTPSPPPRDRSIAPLALILLAIVALAGVTLGVLAAAGVFSNGGAAKTATASSTASKASPRGSASTPLPSGDLPSGAKPCGDGLSAGAATTCPFAQNVQRAFLGSNGTSTIEAYSPNTGEIYAMRCTGEGTIVCRGGNDAIVYLTPGGSLSSSALKPCDENVSAGEVTSCPFAENVFVSYWEAYEAHGEQPETYVSAYSQTKARTYEMSCSSDGVTVECSGGDGAFVTFPMQAVRASPSW